MTYKVKVTVGNIINISHVICKEVFLMCLKYQVTLRNTSGCFRQRKRDNRFRFRVGTTMHSRTRSYCIKACKASKACHIDRGAGCNLRRTCI